MTTIAPAAAAAPLPDALSSNDKRILSGVIKEEYGNTDRLLRQEIAAVKADVAAIKTYFDVYSSSLKLTGRWARARYAQLNEAGIAQARIETTQRRESELSQARKVIADYDELTEREHLLTGAINFACHISEAALTASTKGEAALIAKALGAAPAMPTKGSIPRLEKQRDKLLERHQAVRGAVKHAKEAQQRWNRQSDAQGNAEPQGALTNYGLSPLLCEAKARLAALTEARERILTESRDQRKQLAFSRMDDPQTVAQFIEQIPKSVEAALALIAS